MKRMEPFSIRRDRKSALSACLRPACLSAGSAARRRDVLACATLFLICGAAFAPAFAGDHANGRGGNHARGDAGPMPRVDDYEPIRPPPAALFRPTQEPAYFRRAARDRDNG